MDVAFATIQEMSRALAAGEITSVALTQAVLDRGRALNGRLNAFVRFTEDRALAEAAASDRRRAQGETRGPLDGIPFAVKDIIDVAGEPTMCGLSFLADNIAAEDASAVARLSDAGMVLIGKTHTHQLAFYITGINPDMGTPHNPWSPDHLIPGGSSSGSGVAVAAGIVPVALGSDTAGSIRVPAALCGITGHRPTQGIVGRGGVRPLSHSLDVVGPLTRTAADAALVFDALQGPDARDTATRGRSRVDVLGALDRGVRGLRIAICDTLVFDGCDPEIAAATEAAAGLLRDLGAEVTHEDIPEYAAARDEPHRDIIVCAEAWAVNGRLLEERRAQIDPTGYWMEEGRGTGAAEYYHALRGQEDLQRRLAARMAGIDAFIAPTTAAPACRVADFEAGRGPEIGYTRNVDAGNTLNLASTTVPMGLTASGLPIGLTVNCPARGDAMALRIAHALQRAAPGLLGVPDLGWAGPD